MADLRCFRISDVLNLPIPVHRQPTPITLRDYLIELLATLWEEGDGFSSKRPLGMSDWQWIVYREMVKAGMVTGELDDEDLLDVDHRAADALIVAAIRSFGDDR